jgi:hypothetical protein
MKVLLDTNILLDVLLLRSPWMAQSQLIWKASDEGRIEGCIAAPGSNCTCGVGT